MMSKRKVDDNAVEGSSKQHRRSRSSEPLRKQTKKPEKREVLRRLFNRNSGANMQDNHPRNDVEEETEEEEENATLGENDDPLLDDVPVNLEPGQLGFLVCAQETLRFLHGRGVTADNPMFRRLRSRLLQGIHDIAVA